MAGTVQGTWAIGEDSILRLTWLLIPNGSQGNKMIAGKQSDKTVQVTGTFGTGGSLRFEGSNDGTNWVTINDTAGNALTFTSAGGGLARENYLYIRPNVTAGDGTTSLNALISAPAVDK